MSYKTVLLPVQVPNGIYCWEFRGEYSICGKLSTDGHLRCELNLGELKEDKDGVLKGHRCVLLDQTKEK